jgi:hypothetical protein
VLCAGKPRAYVSSVFQRSLLAGVVGVATTLGVIGACKEDAARADATSCELVYRVCPNVRRATSGEAQECADIFQGTCGANMRQYIQCVTGSCDDGGVVDRAEAERKCFGVLEAYRNCAARPPADAGARPDEGQQPPFPLDASTD